MTAARAQLVKDLGDLVRRAETTGPRHLYIALHLVWACCLAGPEKAKTLVRHMVRLGPIEQISSRVLEGDETVRKETVQ